MRPSLARHIKILCPVKRTVDYAVRVRPTADKTSLDTSALKHAMNPFDEIAVEEALRLRERAPPATADKPAHTVLCASIGPAKCADTLRTALAMGCDQAFHVLPSPPPPSSPDTPTEPMAVARALAALVKKEAVQLVVMGKQAIDGDSSQTGPMLAGLLGWPQATFASKVDLDPQSDQLTVTREIDGGLQTVQLPLPAVVTVDLRLNTPRFASLPNIMKAKKKPLTVLSPGDLGIDLQPRLQTLRYEEPPTRPPGVLVDSVDELVKRLKAAGA